MRASPRTIGSITDLLDTKGLSRVSTNQLKLRLKAGERCFGTWVQSGSPTFAEMAALAGFDFFIVDQEHGPGDLQDAIDQMRAASCAEATMVVRAPSTEPLYVRRLLDAGLEAVLVPMVETAEQARRIVEICRFPPRGVRGNAWPITRAASYGFEADYYLRADDNFMIIVQIETAKAVVNAREIAAVDGVDAVFIGPTDLAGSIGLPDRTGAPEVNALIRKTVEAVRQVGKPLATVPRADRSWAEVFDDGFLMVAYNSEINIYRQALRALTNEWRSFVEEREASTAATGGRSP